MFDDRDQSFTSVQKIGQEIINSQPDEASAAEIKGDLEKVSSLWNSLSNAVNVRKKKLDETLPLSQTLSDKLGEVNKLVRGIENKVDAEKWIPSGKKAGIDKQVEDFAVSFLDLFDTDSSNFSNLI